jgi:hypothetical protein
MFTFSRFLRFLIIINRVNILKFCRSDADKDMTQEESASLLLNLIENSKGYRRAQQVWSVSNAKNGLCQTETYKEYARATLHRSSIQSSSKMVATKSDDRPNFASFKSISKDQRSGREAPDGYDSRVSSIRDNSHSTKRLRSLSKNKKLASALNYRDESLAIFEKYSEPLNQIFALYAGMGEPLNSTKLKSMKFNTLLKDAGILDKVNSISCKPKTHERTPSKASTREAKDESIRSGRLSQVDVDLIVSRLTG